MRLIQNYQPLQMCYVMFFDHPTADNKRNPEQQTKNLGGPVGALIVVVSVVLGILSLTYEENCGVIGPTVDYIRMFGINFGLAVISALVVATVERRRNEIFVSLPRVVLWWNISLLLGLIIVPFSWILIEPSSQIIADGLVQGFIGSFVCFVLGSPLVFVGIVHYLRKQRVGLSYLAEFQHNLAEDRLNELRILRYIEDKGFQGDRIVSLDEIANALECQREEIKRILSESLIHRFRPTGFDPDTGHLTIGEVLL